MSILSILNPATKTRSRRDAAKPAGDRVSVNHVQGLLLGMAEALRQARAAAGIVTKPLLPRHTEEAAG